MSDQPAGWYPDPEQPGGQRYWDGTEWTDHRAPTHAAPPPAKKGGKGWLIPVVLCLALAFIGVVGGAIAGSPDDKDTASTTTAPTGFARCKDGDVSDNADLTAICSSHDGVAAWLAEYGECEDGTVIALRDEPECPNSGNLAKLLPDYEPKAAPDDIALCSDGTYSDNRDLAATCSSHDGVEDWLADYGRCEGGEVIRLDASPRCPGGDNLRELMPQDYSPPTTTTAPPTTAAPTTPPPPPPPTTAGPTISQQNARESASDYLEVTSFSRSGLIEQLEFEGYTTADATWAVDALNPDWNEQAAQSAAQYLEVTSFSRSGLVEQLIFEGFTPEQAEYGVSTTGL